VRDPQDFFNREEVLQGVMRELKLGVRRPIVIQGERGIGKTSLMLRIAHALQHEKHPPFDHFFLAVGHLEDWHHFAWELLDGMSAAMGVSASSIFREAAPEEQPVNFNRLVRMLRAILSSADASADKRIVVMMDEIDKSFVRPQLLQKIITFIYFLLEKADDLPIFFMMSIIARDLPAPPSGSPIPANFFRLGVFDDASLRHMVERLVEDEGISLPRDRLFVWVRALSGGHPYIAKLLLTAVRRELAESTPPASTTWRPEAFLDRALRMEEARHFFEDIYRRFFDDREKALVLELAQRDSAYLSVSEAARWMSADRKALMRLVVRGYLIKESEGFRFGQPLWAHWLRVWPEFEWEREQYPPPGEASAEAPLPARTLQLPDGLCIDRKSQRVYVDGRVVRIRGKYPYRALVYLAEHEGEVVSRDELAEAIYGVDHYMGSNDSIDSIISRIRKDLGEKRPYRFLKTIHGRGYRLEEVTILDDRQPGDPHV
jgi:DNA-binding winged helix-turn-helix (wHTH) protein/nucleoside-triphosphatase THEP1